MNEKISKQNLWKYKVLKALNYLKSSKLFAFLICILLFVIRYFKSIFSFEVYGPFKDNVHFLGPIYTKVSRIIKGGEEPLWIPELVGGIQFYDAAMFSFSYPLYFFGLLSYGVGDDTLRISTLITVLHFLIYFVNTIVLLRVLDRSVFASIIGASTIILSGQLIANSSWGITIAGYSWLPLIIALIINMFKKPNSIVNILLLALAIGALISKPAQPALHAIFFGFVFVIVGFLSNLKSTFKLLPSFLLVGVLSFLLIMAPILIIYLGYEDVVRWTPMGPVYGNDKVPHVEIDFKNKFRFFKETIIYKKRAFGPGHPFVGPVAILFSLFGVITIFINRGKKFLVERIIFLFIFIFGILETVGITSLSAYIPLVNKIREPIRLLFVSIISVSVLCAYGIDFFFKITKNAKWKLLKIPVGIILFCCTIYQYFSYHSGFIPVVIFAIVSLFLLSFSIIKNENYSFNIFIFAVVCSISIIIPEGKTTDSKNWASNTEYHIASMDILKKLKKYSGNNFGRLVFKDKFHLTNAKWAHNAMNFDLRSFYSTLTPLPAAQYDQLFKSDNHFNYRSLWGAKWYITNKESKPDFENNNFKFLFGNNFYSVYENELAKNRYYLTNNIKRLTGNWKSKRKQLAKIDIKKDIVYCDTKDYKIIKNKIQSNSVNSTFVNKIKIIEELNNSQELEIECNYNSLLVINEFFHKNWRIYLNDEPINTFKVNINQIAIPVKSGISNIKIEYEPRLFLILSTIQKITFFIILICLVIYLFVTYSKNAQFKKRNN